MTDQTGSSGFFGLQRQVEADELVVVLDELERLGARADLLGDAVQLVVEDVAQALGEDQREDEVLELGRILRAADAARRIPDPGFERFAVAGLGQGVTSPRSGLRNMRCTVNEHAIVSIKGKGGVTSGVVSGMARMVMPRP